MKRKQLFSFAITVLSLILFLIPTVAAQTEYTDEDTGVRFLVPDHWHQKAMNEERAFLDVKFVNDNYPGSSMIYGSTDAWSQMSAAEKVGLSRSDINNSVFNANDIASAFGIKSDAVTTVTYNNRSYFSFEMSASFSLGELSVSGAMTQLLHIEDGWFYMFQISDTKGGEYFHDFEALMQSVQYPDLSAEATPEPVDTEINISAPTEKDDPESMDMIDQILIIVNVVLLIAVLCGIFVAFYKMITKEKPSAPTPTPIVQEQTCPTCSEKLPLDSAFCHKCGTKIDTKEN